MPPSRLRVASDVGGTFTDNLAYDEAARRVTVAKVPTTPENRALGTVRGLRRAPALEERTPGQDPHVRAWHTTPPQPGDHGRRGRLRSFTPKGARRRLLRMRQ